MKNQNPKPATRRNFVNRLLGVFALGGFFAPAMAYSNSKVENKSSSLVTASPILGQIAIFPFYFAPVGWAKCEGQLLNIGSHTALFSLIGTTYGGNGQITFGLPDLRGRMIMGSGNGPGLTPRPIGQKSGTETNTLVAANLPPAPVTIPATSAAAEGDDPTGAVLATELNEPIYGSTANAAMANGTIQGNSTPVNNMQPYQVLGYYIALTGLYPS